MSNWLRDDLSSLRRLPFLLTKTKLHSRRSRLLRFRLLPFLLEMMLMFWLEFRSILDNIAAAAMMIAKM